MTDLSAFPITKRWPPKHPDRLQLYSLPTPNGVKVSIMLEETGLPYEAHLVDFNKNDQKTPEFLSLNPNGKIPAILDPDGPGGKPLGLFESGGLSLGSGPILHPVEELRPSILVGVGLVHRRLGLARMTKQGLDFLIEGRGDVFPVVGLIGAPEKDRIGPMLL